MLTNLRVRVYESEIFWKNGRTCCTELHFGRAFLQNDNPSDVKLSKLIQLGLKMILDGKFWYFMKLQYP